MLVHDEKDCFMNGVAVFFIALNLSHFIIMVLNNGIYNRVKFLYKDIIDIWFIDVVYNDNN